MVAPHSLLLVLVLLLSWGLTTDAREESVVGNGTLAPIPWKWTTCLGLHGISNLNLAGTFRNYAVVSGNENRIYVVDLANGTLVKNLTLPRNPPVNATFSLLANGVLLQFGWTTITAWAVPGFQQLWTAETFEFGYGTPLVTYSSTGAFFCVPVLPNGYGDYFAPVCFRLADGSQLWTAMGNLSMCNRNAYPGWILETDGVLLVTIQTPGFRRRPPVWTTNAIDVSTGTYLWSTGMTLAILAGEGLAVFSDSTNFKGSVAWDIRTGATVWTNPSLDLKRQTVTVGGLIVTPDGRAYSLLNGSALWAIPSNTSCSSGIAFSTPTHATKEFLCSSSSDGELTYTIGDLRNGELSPTTMLLTPSGDAIFGADCGFFLFGVHQLERKLAEYCLHSLPTNS